MTLACKHVDDVVIGSPYILTEDLIKSLNIKKVVQVTDTDEDQVLPQFRNTINPLEVAQKMGILEQIQIKDEFYDITTEKIA